MALTFREEYRVAARGEAEGADPERVHGEVRLDIPGEKKRIHRFKQRFHMRGVYITSVSDEMERGLVVPSTNIPFK